MNQIQIKQAKPGATIRDDKIKGLHLRVFPGKACWYLAFRTKDGIQRKPKLADLNVMSLDQARKAAAAMLIDVANGADPMQARHDARGAPTVDDLWDRYALEHKVPWKSKKDATRIWTKNIKPRLGSKRVADVTYDDAHAVHKAMRKAPYQANRTKAVLSGMMKRAEKYGWRPAGSNPCRHVEDNPEVARRRYMTPTEAKTISALLRAAEKDNSASVAFIYLLIYTGARCGDIRNARWEHLRGNRLDLPDSKTGAKIVHLPPEAVAVIEKLPRTPIGTLTSIKSPHNLWKRIRKEAGCPDLRLHDLRHSFASVCLGQGLSLQQIGELLGHASLQTTMRYAHLMDDDATSFISGIGSAITARLHPTPKEPVCESSSLS